MKFLGRYLPTQTGSNRINFFFKPVQKTLLSFCIDCTEEFCSSLNFGKMHKAYVLHQPSKISVQIESIAGYKNIVFLGTR